MTDLLAGTTVRAGDTPPTKVNRQVDSYSVTITTFGVAASAGTYNDCAVVFVASTTGRAMVLYDASLDHSGAASTSVAPQIREGATIGSGTIFEDASLDNAIVNIGTDLRRYGAHVTLEGLTPGASYNARLLHRVSAITGTIAQRIITVAPCT